MLLFLIHSKYLKVNRTKKEAGYQIVPNGSHVTVRNTVLDPMIQFY